LPSRNGSSLSCEASSKCIVVAGCLRNRDALASWLRESSEPVGLIAAGERWPDGSLRPCLEDLLGCGAIAAELSGRLSPEARAAVATYDSVKGTIDEVLCECSSGRELIEKGFSIDVRLAAEVDVTDAVPVLKNDAYTSVALLRKL